MTKDLSQFRRPVRHKQDHPKGFEPGVQWEPGKGGHLTVIADTEPDSSIWLNLIEDWDLDPNQVEVVPGTVQVRAWDANMGDGAVQRFKYYRATLRPKGADDGITQADIDSLCQVVAKRKPAKLLVPSDTERSFVALLADWQIGNGENGGSEKIAQQILDGLDKTLSKAKELRKLGRGSDTAYLLGLGDLAEGCLAAETLVQTKEGLFRIDELAARGKATIKTDYGAWVEAEFRSFGYQRLYKIDVTRGNAEKTIYATDNHRWFKLEEPTRNSGKVESFTIDLEKGDMLVSNFGKHPKSVSPVGVMAGFVFGDGHKKSKERPEMGSAVNLHRNDWGMLHYFAGHPTSEVLAHGQSGSIVPTENSDYVLVSGLPSFFKDRPDIRESLPFLYGWAAGYFAADGCVDKKGGLTISSSSKDNLEFFASVCARIGIGTNPINLNYRNGVNDYPTALYTMSLCPQTIDEDFLVHPDKREKFSEWQDRPRKRQGYTWQTNRGRHWLVDSVEETDRYEEVYCAVVPDTHSFTLDNDLLTGNCTGWYEMQAYSTDLNIREQDRLVRHLLLNWIDAFVDAQFQVVTVGCAGNHGEQRKDGKAYTGFSDNRDVQVFEIVAEIMAQNPERYGNVYVPLEATDKYDLTVTLDISGVPVSIAHGHQFGNGTGSTINKIENWLKGQALGRQAVADCEILFSGHFHHFVASEGTGRQVFQAPASDAGSAWFTSRTGKGASHGVLSMNIGNSTTHRGWSDLDVL